MKILMVINSLHTGGAEKMVAAMLPLMRHKNATVDLLLVNGTETPFLKQLQTTFDGNIHSLGGNLYNPLQAMRMKRYLKQYDIVHVHLFPVLYWAGLAKFLGRGRYKLIFTEHSTANNRRGNFIFRLIDKFIYRQYDRIVCITEEVKSLLQKHLAMADNRFKVIHNGVDLHGIANAHALSKRDLNLADDAFALVQVSSFRYPKDQLTVIRALQHLPANVSLLLVGDGPEIDKAKKLAEDLNLAARVHFLGIRTDIPAILKTADVIILSSAYEGLSLSSLEGMAAGRPFVATDVAGLRDVVGSYGILFPLASDKRLAEIVERLLTDTAYYQKTLQDGIARAAEFDIDKTVAAHLALYQSLIRHD